MKKQETMNETNYVDRIESLLKRYDRQKCAIDRGEEVPGLEKGLEDYESIQSLEKEIMDLVKDITSLVDVEREADLASVRRRLLRRIGKTDDHQPGENEKLAEATRRCTAAMRRLNSLFKEHDGAPLFSADAIPHDVSLSIGAGYAARGMRIMQKLDEALEGITDKEEQRKIISRMVADGLLF